MYTPKTIPILYLIFLIAITGCKTEKYDSPIVPLQDFFKNPEIEKVMLSGSGEYFSYIKPYKNRMNIFVENIESGDTTQITFSENRDITYYFWANDNRIIYLKDEDNDDLLDFYAVDINGQNRIRLTNFEGLTPHVIDELSSDPEHILVALNKRDKSVFDLYRLNINTGDFSLHTRNPGNVTRWVTDNDGNTRIGISSDGVNKSVLYRNSQSENFKVLFTNNFKELFEPLFFSFDNRYIYASTNFGSDKATIVKYDPVEKKILNTLYSHPEVDVEEVLRSEKQQKIVGVSFNTWKREYHFFDENYSELFKKIQMKLPGYEIAITSHDRDESKFLIRTYSDRSLGAYYLFDSGEGIFKKLAEISPWLKEGQMARMKPIRYKSRDGKTIHGYLTLPKGFHHEDLPVVIYPHGGPWLRDNWGFRNTVQFFANRGYAVLQMNYRGSTGYGREFFEAGFKQWGGAIQDDITDGVNWLIRQGIADKERIAIVGFSFGGYAALSGLTKTPHLYSCGVDYAGISNIFSFLESIPPYWTPVKDMLYEMVGDPVADSLMLYENSPVFHTDHIKVPVFIAHGVKDKRSSIKDVKKLIHNLKANKVDVQYLIKKDEGHGFKNQENRFDYYRHLEKFLAKNLGGRLEN